jgi:3-hydroxymyristoyl/3-hydroxydecanoyl-(acyl carrier protein) dehydratase
VAFVPDARLFEGHFDEAPVLPGVAHIALAVRACADRGLESRPLAGVRDVRFARPLGPGDAIEIRLDPGRNPDSIRFEIHSGGSAASSGMLVFAAPDHGTE